MNIIKQDIKTFWKPTVIYIVVIQLLIYLGISISEAENMANSVILEYFSLFVITSCYIASFVYTVLFALYYNTKSNNIHRGQYQLTDGYGLYRFITTFLLILLITINVIIAFQVNGVDVINLIKAMPYYQLAMVLFPLLPTLTLEIISIGHAHNRKLIRNLEAQISILVIFIGIYIAGNLYYFDNPQQGVGILIILFIPLAILFMSIKERNSERKIYKNIVFIFCGIIAITTIGLFATSNMKYNTTGTNGQFEPLFESTTIPIESKLVDSEYGQIIKISKEKTEVTYDLATANYSYHWNSFGADYDYFNATVLNGADSITINMGLGQTDSEVVIENYDLQTNTLTSCTAPLSKIAESECQVEDEVMDVFHLLQSLDE